MSGHSKWATTHRKKERIDAQRGKIFTRIGRELAVAVREGGPDPASNSRLRDVIAKAKANNMPNDNIARSIKKASGAGAGDQYEECTYEGYGPGGVAVIVETLTDNRNRTAAEMRHFFDKSGGSLGATGCVGWMFDRKGVIIVDKEGAPDGDEVMMLALDAGAEDFSTNEDNYEIETDPSSFSEVREKLEAAGLSFLSAEVEMIPQNTASLDEETAAKVNRLLDWLDDYEDVQNVYHNAELPDEE